VKGKETTMTDFRRRDFLRGSATALAAAPFVWSRMMRAAAETVGGEDAEGGARDVFARVEPSDVGVDGNALEKAVAFVAADFERGTYPGACLAATRNGSMFLEQYWGTCAGRTGPALPYNGSVLNMLFSFSKAITATVVVMAHQDGLIDYDAPVSQYIPEFRGGGKDAVTVRHLLTHAAGIPSAPSMPVHTEEQWDAAIEALCRLEVEWAPGSRTLYHAITGMLLAADIVRRVSGGKLWQEICQERLFKPLGAEGFTFGMPSEDADVALVPPPSTFPAELTPTTLQFLGNPAAGAFGRPADMLKLLNLHLNKGTWNGRQLIQPEAYEEMHTVQYENEIREALAKGRQPQHEYFGLGWLLRGATEEGWFGFGNVASERSFGHAGIDTVMAVADPDVNAALVFLTTASPGDAEATVRLRNTVTNLVFSAVYGTGGGRQ